MAETRKSCEKCGGPFENDPIKEFRFIGGGQQLGRLVVGAEEPLCRCPKCVPTALEIMMVFQDVILKGPLGRMPWTAAMVVWVSGKEEPAWRAAIEQKAREG